MPTTHSDRPRLRLAPPVLQHARELRHPLTPAEQRLWSRLRRHALGAHIRRQHVLLGHFIPDFYCALARLCIEIDGDGHAQPEQAEYDADRITLLESRGFRVIRFTNAEVFGSFEGVLMAIQVACRVERP